MIQRETGFMPYQIVSRGGSGEITEKKSRFIATVGAVESEEEAASFIEAVKKKYYDARHNCSAYIIGRNREIIKYSDDGEPGGTAGKPILEVITGAGLVNTVIVVTRYFGGTLLGTGGLARAYTQAAQEGLAASETVTMRYGEEININAAYSDAGKIKHLIALHQLEILNAVYTESVEFLVRLPIEKSESFSRELLEATAARICMKSVKKGYYMDKAGKVKTK